MKRSLPLIASALLLPGIAPAQTRPANDLTVANMQQCLKAMGKDYLEAETPILVCGGHNRSVGTDADRKLQFKSKRSGLQVELRQQFIDYNVAVYTEAPLVQYKVRYAKGEAFIEKRQPHAAGTRVPFESLSAPLRSALQQGLMMMKLLRNTTWTNP